MTPNYTYINSPDYINGLTFDYVETYSFQRGNEYEENLQSLRSEYDRLKNRKRRSTLTNEEQERMDKLHDLVGFTQYLINDKGALHPSAKKTNTFKIDDPVVARIIQILQTEVVDVPSWMCGPVYRDAIVFYDSNGKIVSVLNICLSCEYMETKMFNYVDGDYKTYDLFKRFFINIGHEVERPDYFVLDELNKMRRKKL